jgi:hypothetical protein
MHTHLRWLARRVALLTIAGLTVGSCLLPPAAAEARGRDRLQSTVGEESATEALQEPVSESETPTTPEETTPGSQEESSTGTRGEQRRERREERRKLREERRADRQAVQQTGSCAIDLKSSKRIATADEPLTLQGTLTCAEAQDAAEQTVTLYQKLARTPGFNVVATTSTEGDGTFELSLSDLEANSVFYVSADGAHSARTSVKVAPQITIASPTAGTELFTGTLRALRASAENTNVVTFSGTVSAADAGATVSLQREYRKDAWHRIGGGGVVNEEGRYSIAHTFVRPGEASIRAVVHSHGLFMTSASAPVTYQISRRRSRQLTIESSDNPSTYGQPLTISGTLPGTLNRTVTLLAAVGAGAYAPVAQVTSEDGKYRFSESPTAATHYRTIAGSASSETLAQGVTYALTPAAARASVAAGTEVTFTGTVAPAREGQLVELERESTPGGSYSIIATAALPAGGTYSIPYTFTEAASETLRISVPGNAELLSATSEPFSIEVASSQSATS